MKCKGRKRLIYVAFNVRFSCNSYSIGEEINKKILTNYHCSSMTDPNAGKWRTSYNLANSITSLTTVIMSMFTRLLLSFDITAFPRFKSKFIKSLHIDYCR